MTPSKQDELLRLFCREITDTSMREKCLSYCSSAPPNKLISCTSTVRDMWRDGVEAGEHRAYFLFFGAIGIALVVWAALRFRHRALTP